MTKVMPLLDVIRDIASFDEDHTIYAKKPWTAQSSAIVVWEPDEGDPPEPGELGFAYFLEIFIALEVIEGWMGNIDYSPTVERICDRVIYYATYDA